MAQPAGVPVSKVVLKSNVPTQQEAEEGTAQVARAWTAQRIKQAIDALAPAGSSPDEGQRSATLVVAANNSSADGKSGADYTVPNGQPASATIQEALDEIAATGGKVVLLEGTYTLDDTLTVSGTNVTVEGMGFGTLLVAGESWNSSDPLIRISLASRDILLTDFALSGDAQIIDDAILILGPRVSCHRLHLSEIFSSYGVRVLETGKADL